MKNLQPLHVSAISSPWPLMSSTPSSRFFALSLTLCALSLFYALSHLYLPSRVTSTLAQAQATQIQADLRKCGSIVHEPYWVRTRTPRNINPRFSRSGSTPAIVVLKNVTLYDGESWLPEAVDVMFRQGLVTEVTVAGKLTWETEGDTSDVHIHNLWGLYVTPGLVDLHSHSAVYSYPHLRGECPACPRMPSG